MRTAILNEAFITAIREKIPHKTAIANNLADILSIEKEAVYRRLRGEVAFTFAEVITISEKLGISLDNFANFSHQKSKPFQLKMIDVVNPDEEDFEMISFLVDNVNRITDFSETEYGTATNMIPVSLSISYDYIFRFYVFKWMYQYQSPKVFVPFSEVIPDKEMMHLLKQYPEMIDKGPQNCYIWDEMIFNFVVNDIHYFNAIRLISDEEKAILKTELHKLLDDIEALAIKGVNKYGNKVYFYISNIDFETSYSYVTTPNLYLTMITAFTLNQVISTDKETFFRLKQFMQSLKRTSTLISESGEVYRIQFFDKQRALVNTL